jgi:hypothetical protein
MTSKSIKGAANANRFAVEGIIIEACGTDSLILCNASKKTLEYLDGPVAMLA